MSETTQTENEAIRNIQLIVGSLEKIHTILNDLRQCVTDLQEVSRAQQQRLERVERNVGRSLAGHVESYHAGEA
jgi:hypothetical protein